MHHRHIAVLLLFVFAAAMPSLVSAKVTQVGPTQFHKQMHIPNTLGRNGAANNDDGYTPQTRQQQRANKRAKRQQDQNAANDESRTASDTNPNAKRKGRRDRQHDARKSRMQDRAMDRAVGRLSDKAKSAVND
jgi:hypothetical protein